jgi:hypothetical protein
MLGFRFQISIRRRRQKDEKPWGTLVSYRRANKGIKWKLYFRISSILGGEDPILVGVSLDVAVYLAKILAGFYLFLFLFLFWRSAEVDSPRDKSLLPSIQNLGN